MISKCNSLAQFFWPIIAMHAHCRNKQVAVKVMFEDELDRVSNDSGTYSNGSVYCAATYSPKTKSGSKKISLRKKHSFSAWT